MELTRLSLTTPRPAPSIGHRPPAFREPLLASWYAPSFSDVLGDRLLLHDNTGGDALEMLRLRAHLTVQPEFESRLRAQALILKGFHSPSFAPIHSVERLEDTGNALAVVSSYVAGVRLSEVLHRIDQGRGGLPVNAALFIIRQLAQALAGLHSHASGLTHGALSPERVVLTENGTVIVVEHALGAALAALRYDRHRFWTELRLATLPGTPAATIDPRTDVLQIGLIALSTILGRSLTADDFPQGIDALLFEADHVLRDGHPYSRESVFRWLERALQQNTSTSFGSAVEAAKALAGWHDSPDAEPQSAPPPRTEKPRSRKSSRNTTAHLSPTATVFVPSLAPDPQEIRRSVSHRILTTVRHHAASNRRIWIPVSAAAGTLAATLAVVGVPAATDGPAALVIATVPAGATVRVDGRQIGVTPLRQMLEPGKYQLEVSKDEEVRRFSISLRSNQELTQYIEMTKVTDRDARSESPAPALSDLPLLPASTATTRVLDAGAVISPARAMAPTGTLLVSSPVEVEIFQDGRLLGVGGSKEISVPAGRLVLDLVNRELDFRTTTPITIVAGRQYTLAVALPQGVLHVNAQPWAEVSIDGQRLGETPVGNIQLSIGRHKVVFQHPELGTASRDVLIKASGESRVTVDLRRTSAQ